MSTISVNDNTTWRVPNMGIKVNDGGTWRQILSVQRNDGGVWRYVYDTYLPSLISAYGDMTQSYAFFSIDEAGVIQVGATVGFSGEILESGLWSHRVTTPVTHYVRATVNSGADPDTGTLDTWLSLDTLRIWELTAATPQTTILQIDLSSESDGSIIVATNEYFFGYF
jgi:hypothetical protein